MTLRIASITRPKSPILDGDDVSVTFTMVVGAEACPTVLEALDMRSIEVFATEDAISEASIAKVTQTQGLAEHVMFRVEAPRDACQVPGEASFLFGA